jgi:hypothetical protein
VAPQRKQFVQAAALALEMLNVTKTFPEVTGARRRQLLLRNLDDL